jgi:hypothetical protein
LRCSELSEVLEFEDLDSLFSFSEIFEKLLGVLCLKPYSCPYRVELEKERPF